MRVPKLSALLAPIVALASCAPSGRPDLDVRDHAIVGDELRLVVVTLRHCTPPWSHSSRIADVKGWYVTIDLASDAPVEQRARVYGPLWDLPEPRSGLAFEAGVTFSEEDAARERDLTPLGFDPDGTLQRFTIDPARHGTIVRDLLVAEAKGAAWRRQNDVKPIADRLPPMSEDRLESPSGRWLLLRYGKIVQLFDRATGEAKDDAWLTGSFGRARSIPRFENVCYSLTEDLDHLVVSPQPMWNTGARDPVETFELDGRTWTRADVGIVFHRPDPAPHVFQRKPATDGGDTWNSPRDGFTIRSGGAGGSELRLFSFDDRTLRLWRPQGVEEGAADPGPDLVKVVGDELRPKVRFYWQVSHPAGSETLQLFHFDAPTPTTDFRDVVGVVTWDCAANTLVDREARLIDLFEVREQQLVPRAPLPVR